ncbi:MAG: glycerol kinase GlpK [Gemmatimonadaceae bacterium]|nr:glycerol kinase GlpK [Gemmatimonadaceae bacterium]
MTCVLAIDQGTTGTTCLVIARDGAVIGRAYREITQHYPQPGWVEHNAHEILERSLDAAREAMAHAKAATGDVPSAIGITNQRETIVLWERATGRAVHHAIVWQDRRTAARCAELAPHAAMIAARTGLVTDPYFSGTKLEWLLAQGDHRARAERGELCAGTIDSWLIWHLTGGQAHVTDHTNASRTMLYDLDTRAWSPELCALFGIPMEVLPRIVASSGECGRSTAATLGSTIPITGIAGDQQAALFGQGGWAPGAGKNTYGTGAFLLLNTGAQRPAPGGGLLTTIACDEQGAPVFALEASIFIAGAAVQWLRDGLGLIHASAETEALARSVASNDGVYFVPALVGLGAPDWEPNARGTIVGLTRGTTRAHLARAALEAMAYATRDVLGDMRSHGGVAFERLRVDGGASANDWLMQFQSDVLGVPVERPDLVETTALGAAGLAGLAVGVWANGAEFQASRHFARFAPTASGAAAATASYGGWRRAVRAALSWARDTDTA